jgi:hypothetical protein
MKVRAGLKECRHTGAFAQRIQFKCHLHESGTIPQSLTFFPNGEVQNSEGRTPRRRMCQSIPTGTEIRTRLPPMPFRNVRYGSFLPSTSFFLLFSTRTSS